jgi:DedD protein
MDRRVKERLIGATILVALIVLIVPELLSGPKQPSVPPLTAGLPTPTRNVSVDLATSRATPEPQTAGAASALDSPGGDAPAAAASAVSPGTEGSGESAPTVTTLRAQESPAAALETQPSSPKYPLGTANSGASNDAGRPSAAGRAWAVQLGSFASKANADNLAHQLQARNGASIYVISSGSGPSLRYRVRLGPLADRGAAERAVVKLKAEGHPATIVTPAS